MGKCYQVDFNLVRKNVPFSEVGCLRRDVGEIRGISPGKLEAAVIRVDPGPDSGPFCWLWLLCFHFVNNIRSSEKVQS